jgi:hypothetical protein
MLELLYVTQHNPLISSEPQFPFLFLLHGVVAWTDEILNVNHTVQCLGF